MKSFALLRTWRICIRGRFRIGRYGESISKYRNWNEKKLDTEKISLEESQTPLSMRSNFNLRK